ncbi:MAG: hypothetical protein QM750_08580 [Rubrivivax sp.]
MLKSCHLAALAILLSAATAALAEGPLCYPDANADAGCAAPKVLNSGRTRAEVIAAMSEPAYVEPASTLTRAEVVAEYQRARARGELSLYDEDSGAHWLALEYARKASQVRLAAARLLAAR